MPPSRTATEPAKRKKPRKGRNDRMHGERQRGSIISHPTRPGKPHHGCPLGSPSPSPPRREPRPGEVGLAGWGVSDQSCAPPSHRAHAFAGGRGYSARQAGRQLFGGDHHVALASSTSTCPLLPCCTDHCGFGRKRKGGHFGAGSETTQVHCRQGPRGPSSTTNYVRTVAVHGANNWETTGACIMRGAGLSFGSLVGWESCNGSMQLRKQPGDLMS